MNIIEFIYLLLQVVAMEWEKAKPGPLNNKLLLQLLFNMVKKNPNNDFGLELVGKKQRSKVRREKEPTGRSRALTKGISVINICFLFWQLNI